MVCYIMYSIGTLSVNTFGLSIFLVHFSRWTGLLQTDRVLRSTHVTALVRYRSEQLRAVVDPLRDSVKVNVTKLAIVYTSLFNNRVPRRCHNVWNWFWCTQTTLTTSGPSVCWWCVTNVQLLLVTIYLPGGAWVISWLADIVGEVGD